MCEKVLKKSICVLISLALVIQFVPSRAFAKAQTSATSNEVELTAESEEDASLQATTKYTVTFNSNGGSSVAKQTVTSGGVAKKPANPTKSGHRFVNWYSNSALTTVYNFNTKVTSNKTLYAKWIKTYTVTFNSNGGTSVAKQTIDTGKLASKPKTDPTKTGYTFGGWYTDSACTKAYNFNTKVTSNKTLYAKWIKTYTVTFNSNGGTSVAKQTINTGTKATKPNDPSKTGYKFDGWYTDANCTKAFNFSTAITADTKLYAKWIKQHEVKFVIKDGPDVKSQTVNDGARASRPTVQDREGYNLVWFSDEDYKTPWYFTYSVTDDVTLYAKWEKKIFNVEYNPNWEQDSINVEIEYGNKAKNYDPKDLSNGFFAKKWCDFGGWYTDPNCSEQSKYDFQTSVTSNLILYAKWIPIDYKLTFYDSDKKTTLYSKTVTAFEEFTQPMPSKKGYIFQGWYRSNGKEFKATKIDTDTNVYAKWEAEKCDVTFDLNDGSKVTTKTIEYGKKAKRPANPTRKGYTFKGWFTDEKCTKEYKFGTVTKDVTLYAKWASNASSTNKSTKTTSALTMYRLYNQYTGEHFYTSSTNEKANLVKSGWKYEGVGWKAPKTSRTPVYRLYNKYVSGGDHHYTTSKSEKDSLVRQGWTYEGIGWYSDDNKGVPLYRQYNPFAKSGTHNYTSKKSENNNLVKNGWKAENIAWYGVK